MTEATEEPVVRHQVVMPGAPERAFTAFTERFDAIKPREHNMLASPIVSTTFEPRVGGHIVDRTENGTECRWARVLLFDPPDRLVFSWDIGPTWQLEADPENASEVEVRFVADGPDRTRVELEHRRLDRHGPGWPQLRAGVDDERGWRLYLARYSSILPAAAGRRLGWLPRRPDPDRRHRRRGRLRHRGRLVLRTGVRRPHGCLALRLRETSRLRRMGQAWCSTQPNSSRWASAWLLRPR